MDYNKRIDSSSINQMWFLNIVLASKTTAIVSRSTDDSTKFVLDGGAMTKGTQLQLSAFNSRSPKQSYQMEIAGRWNDLVMNVAGGNPTAGTPVILSMVKKHPIEQPAVYVHSKIHYYWW